MGSFFGSLFSGISNLITGSQANATQQQANAVNQQNTENALATNQAQFAQSQEDWGITNQQQQNQIAFENQQQLAQQQFANNVTMGGNIGSVLANVVAAANASGLSPLAVVGQQFPGASVVPGVGPGGGAGPTPTGGTGGGPAVGSGNNLAAMGQDVGRAVEGFFDANSRKAALAEEYTRAQITNLDAQSASLTMDAARKLGAPGTPKPNTDLNHFIFGKEPQWPVGIPGDLATGLFKGIDWGAGKLDHLGQWFEHLRVNEPDPSVYNTP